MKYSAILSLWVLLLCLGRQLQGTDATITGLDVGRLIFFCHGVLVAAEVEKRYSRDKEEKSQEKAAHCRGEFVRRCQRAVYFWLFASVQAFP